MPKYKQAVNQVRPGHGATIPALRKLGQEDYYKLKASLGTW